MGVAVTGFDIWLAVSIVFVGSVIDLAFHP